MTSGKTGEPPAPRVTVPHLLVVSDRGILPLDRLPAFLDRILDRVPPGTVGVYLREPGLPVRDVLDAAGRLVDVASRRDRRAPVLVRARADLALAAGASGVHLQAHGASPAELRAAWPGLLLGYSAHAIDEVASIAPQVDYVAFSPVFDVPSKGPPTGPAALAAACRAAGSTPVLALGGIAGGERAAEARRAGAWGVAAIRAVLAAADPAAAAVELLRAVETVI
jgi:thiamine-phosphate pyrophosphorylase